MQPAPFYNFSCSLWYSICWSKVFSIIHCRQFCKHPTKHRRQIRIHTEIASPIVKTLSNCFNHEPIPPSSPSSQLPRGSRSCLIFCICSCIHCSCLWHAVIARDTINISNIGSVSVAGVVLLLMSGSRSRCPSLDWSGVGFGLPTENFCRKTCT